MYIVKKFYRNELTQQQLMQQCRKGRIQYIIIHDRDDIIY